MINSPAQLRTGARTAAAIVTVVGAIVVTGWAFDLTALTSLAPGWVSMKANTALAFMACGIALWLASDPASRESPTRTRASAVFAALAISIGVITLVEYAVGGRHAFDELVFRDSRGFDSPGRMAPYSAISFVLAGVSILTLRRRNFPKAIDAALTLPIFGVGLLNVASYAFSVPVRDDIFGFPRLALHSALTFILLSAGIVAARGQYGVLGVVASRGAGGRLARRLLPLAVALPLMVGWLRLRGQQIGLFGPELSLTIGTVLTVVVFTVLIWWGAASLESFERARETTTAALQRSEHQYRRFFDQAPVALFRTLPGGEVLDANPALHELLGAQPGSLVGADARKWYAQPADRAAFEATIAQDGFVRDQPLQLRRVDGSTRWVLDSTQLIRTETGEVSYEGGLIDVTERHESQEALRESNERFREMALYVNEAFFVIDVANERLLYVSPMWAKIWDRPMTFAYERDAWVGSIHPADRAGVLASHLRVRSGEAHESVYRILRPDHSVRWIRRRAFPVVGAEGSIERVVGVAEDITDLRRAEEHLAHSQKMDAVGRLAGGVAHDFNNLLTVILAEASTLQSIAGADIQLIEPLAEIRRAAESASSLTRQLLSFSRKQLTEPVVFDVNDAISDTAKMLRRLIGEHVRLEIVPIDGGGFIRADRAQFQQVLTNLAVNARDAMPNGGLLTMHTAEKRIDAAAIVEPDMTAGDYVELTVRDTGVGMTPEVRARAFEPFFTTKEWGRGTGLGLATTHGIVRQAGGNITVESEPGVGTTFRIRFPRVANGVAAGVPQTDTKLNEPRGALTVLMVEDEPAVRRVGARILRMEGYNVLEAADGFEALTILKEFDGEIALFFTDVVLPGMGGRELVQRALAIRPSMPVLFTTGYSNDMMLDHQLDIKAIMLLQKPYTRATLAAKIRAVLER